MRNLRIVVISLFLVVSILFCVVFAYTQFMLDRTPPMIRCDGTPLQVSVKATDQELCSGLTATDDVDGDLTDRIIVRKVSKLVGNNTATVNYAVFDSSSNFCTFSRNVYYTDYCKPKFALSQPLIYSVSSTVNLQDRLTASDVIDGDISGRIRVSSANLTNTAAGKYPISVQVTNSSGDTSILQLTVTIQNTVSTQPIIRLSDYLIYINESEHLTIDDFRAYIDTVQSDGILLEPVDPSQVQISGFADINNDGVQEDLFLADGSFADVPTGSYDVAYFYTNQDGQSYEVILTVVKE